MLWFDFRFVPFWGLLVGHPKDNSFAASCVPALLAGVLGFWRAKPNEIWSYGLLMWMPRALRFGAASLIYRDDWLIGVALMIVLSSFLAAGTCVLASYAGFALRKLVSRIAAVPQKL